MDFTTITEARKLSERDYKKVKEQLTLYGEWMGKYGESYAFLLAQEKKGKETQLRTLPQLSVYEFEYWKCFVLLSSDLTFIQVEAYGRYIGELDIIEFFDILKTIQGAVQNGRLNS